MIYLDTSAFIKLYFLEEGSEFVQSCVVAQDEPLPVWELLRAEFMNACRLKVFWKDISDADADRLIADFYDRLRRGQYFVPDIDRSELMSQFRSMSIRTARLGCRTLDILHVACASQMNVSSFVSYDERQRSLAAECGMRVLPTLQNN